MKHRFAMMCLVTVLFAGAVAAPALAAEEATGKHKSVLELFETTGWVGWLMVATSIIGTVLCIQNVVEIRMDKLAPPDLTKEIEDAINEGDLDRALDVAMSSRCYCGQVSGGRLMLEEAGYGQMVNGMAQGAAAEACRLEAIALCLNLTSKRIIEMQMEASEPIGRVMRRVGGSADNGH